MMHPDKKRYLRRSDSEFSSSSDDYESRFRKNIQKRAHKEEEDFLVDFSELCEDKAGIVCEKSGRIREKSSSDYCPLYDDILKKRFKESMSLRPSLVASMTGQPGQSGKGERFKKFVVSFRNKFGHPWSEYNKGSKSIYINGKNGPVIHLYKNKTYIFSVQEEERDVRIDGNAFSLTNSPSGGPKSTIIEGGFTPVSKGCVCLKVTNNTPKYFFYQDSMNKYCGGIIIVHEKQLPNSR